MDEEIIDEVEDTSEETLEVEEEEEVVEDTTEEEEVNENEAEIERLRKENLTLKAQKEHFKKKANKKDINTSSDASFTREEAVLIAQGMDLEDLDNLKVIQKGQGLKTFKEAVESPLFVAYSKAKKAEKKRKESSLGASKGSGGSSDTVFKPDMSEEEHRKAWKEAQE